MTRRRRAVLLLGLAVLLGSLAASDISRREAALRAAAGPGVPVVVASRDLRAGELLDRRSLGVRRAPARFRPQTAYADPATLEGARAAIAMPRGTDVLAPMVDDGTRQGPPVAPGERVAELVARGSAELIQPGGRVDVLVTRQEDDGGRTDLALEAVEVLAARPAPVEDGEDARRRVAVSLRVSVGQAVFLAQAESFAREIRLLARAQGDTRRVRTRPSPGPAAQARPRSGR